MSPARRTAPELNLVLIFPPVRDVGNQIDAEQTAAALQQAADVDHAAMLTLRDDLLRFMADADSQCRTIIEHHEARLPPGAVVSNQSST